MASSSGDRDAPTNLGPGTGGSGPNLRRDAPTNLGPGEASPSDPSLRDAPTRLGSDVATGDLVGSLIRDRYRVVSELGRGGMGVVFEVEDTFAGGTFALKRLSAELSGRPEWVQSFVREATAAMAFSVRSDRFVTTYGVDRDSSGPFLVMERVGLPTLRVFLSQWASGERPGVPLLRALVQELAMALSELHGAGFLHRDPKQGSVGRILAAVSARMRIAPGSIFRESLQDVINRGFPG